MLPPLTPGLVVNALGGALVAALGLGIGLVRPRRRTNMLLAAFAVLFGATFTISNVWGRDATWGGLPFTVPDALGTAASVPLLGFAWTLGRRRGREPAAFLVVPLAAAGAVAWAAAMPAAVPLPFYVTALFVANAAALPLFALRTRAADTPAADRRTLALVTGGLLMWPGVAAGIALPLRAPLGYAFGGVLLLVALLWLDATRRGDAAARRRARNLVLLTLALPLVGMLTYVGTGGLDGAATGGVTGVARLATVLTIGYAILRHQLLGIDVRVKWTLRQSTVASFFVAAFFGVPEILQAATGRVAGSEYWGVAAATALVFFLTPLQRLADGVANAAMPDVRSPGQMRPAERATLYYEAAKAAWANGSLSRDERALLDRMRASLGLGAEETARLELRAAAGDGGPGPLRRAPGPSARRRGPALRP